MTTRAASTASGNAPQRPYPAASSTARQITEQRQGAARAVLRSLARTCQGRPPAQVYRVLRDALRPLGLRLPAAAQTRPGHRGRAAGGAAVTAACLTMPSDGHRQLTLDGSRPDGPPSAEVELVRFLAKVVVDPRPGGCLHWVGAIGDDGYGRFQAGARPAARTVRPHAWVFERATGMRPVRLRLLHSCDETGCVALEHLTVGTQAENVAQMHRRGRGWRRHTGTADPRGPAGRARAIRAALAAGWDEAAFTAAVAAGDPFCRQLALPVLAQFSRTWPRPQGSGVGQTGTG